MQRNAFFIPAFLLCTQLVFSQNKATVYGTVTDSKGDARPEVNVVLFGQSGVGSTSDKNGNYIIEIPANDTIVLAFSSVGYKTEFKKIFPEENKYYKLNIALILTDSLQTVVITETRRNEIIMQIPIEQIEYIPDPSGDPLIGILKKYVTSNNELSSQYSVRGGNYDENLVYVNDFEIYRPLLIRSGQQEGLAFPNYDLIQTVYFSAGGFEAKYGDKLSSVLDIQYKKPKKFETGVTASLLGGSFYVNDGSDSQKVYYLFGARYKSNQYLLNSLNTKGEYKPVFYDAQALFGIKINAKSTLEFLGNISSNKYAFVPESRVTSTGVVNNVIRLEVFFDGQEVDEFITAFGGISYQYRPKKYIGLKILASGYRSLETETFDIIGDYLVGQVEENLGSENFNQINAGLGVGTFQNFARNYLTSTVANIGHEGYYEKGSHFIRWGARAQYELINDELKEWVYLDSAGYSLPYTGEQVSVQELLRSSIDLESYRFNAYTQDTWTPNKNDNFSLTGGLRSSYWTVNKETTLSPRLQAAWKPDWKRKDSSEYDIILKAAAGLYQQPPFYRELRNQQGIINTGVQSQKSIHFLIGADYNFKGWGRDFKLVSEIYYKYLYDLIPYDIDNVRIRYYATNNAVGYAEGIDLRLFGEIVKDAQSWVSLSVLRTQENIAGDSTYELQYNSDGAVDTAIAIGQGFIPRPTDQLVNFGMFFQDYIPGNKNIRVHLNFLFGSGLPFGPPNNIYYRDAFRIPPYRRVDIGFSALLIDKNRVRKKTNMFSNIESLWAGIEVFNLLGVANTISYIWIKDINNTQYAFPNYLTDRRVNLKFVMKI